ncbi:MAG: hypothetical protein MJ096_00890, partial [Clostridia bacterium]|nr:hypothetical protein [Clostridia bacterium]
DRTNGYHYLGVYNMSTGHSSCYWPATEQYLQYLGDMGIDVGAHFIAYDGYFNDDLAEGAYRFPEK